MYYRVINKKKKAATIIADFLGYVIWTPVNLFVKKRHLSAADIKEILVIRSAYIGDVVMALPILKPLRILYPNARITFLTTPGARELLLNNRYVDNILTYDAFWFYPKAAEAFSDYWNFLKRLRSKEYDLVIETRADIRDILLLAYFAKSRFRVSYKVGGGGYLLTHIVPFDKLKHRVDYHLDMVKFLGAAVDNIAWDIGLTPEDEAAAEALLSTGRLAACGLLIGIHPGGRKKLKCWAGDKFAKLADRLSSECNAGIIFTGSPDERGLIDDMIKHMECNALNLAGKTNLRTLAALIKRFNLFICNDTAPLHIASAVNTPCVAIFGPSKSKETGPYGNIQRVVERDFPCRAVCDEDVCNYVDFNACMAEIQPEEVLSAAKEVLKQAATRMERHGL